MFELRVLRIAAPSIAFSVWAAAFLLNEKLNVVEFRSRVDGPIILVAAQLVGSILGLWLVPETDRPFDHSARTPILRRDIELIVDECRRSNRVALVVARVHTKIDLTAGLVAFGAIVSMTSLL